MPDCSNQTGYDVLPLRIDFVGQEFPWFYPLALNGREIDGIYVGGIEYAPAEYEYELEGGHIMSITLAGGTRYVKERTCEPIIKGGRCTCSECGCTWLSMPRYCNRCGAEVISE